MEGFICLYLGEAGVHDTTWAMQRAYTLIARQKNQLCQSWLLTQRAAAAIAFPSSHSIFSMKFPGTLYKIEAVAGSFPSSLTVKRQALIASLRPLGTRPIGNVTAMIVPADKPESASLSMKVARHPSKEFKNTADSLATAVTSL